jgi:5-deoxy-glucuronate isomerase
MIGIDGDEVMGLLDPAAGRLGCARCSGRLCVASTRAVAWVVAECGSGRAELDGVPSAIDDRGDVFAAAGWSALIAPGSTLRVAGDVACTIVWRAADAFDERSRIIDSATVPVDARGSGSTARTVRTYLASGALVAGETLNPAGGWSSWPPHSHSHEELYLYRFASGDGFGVHVDLSGGARIVRDGDVVRIVGGEHPVVSAPGTAMYYLWALAGDTDTPDTRVDPRWSG